MVAEDEIVIPQQRHYGNGDRLLADTGMCRAIEFPGLKKSEQRLFKMPDHQQLFQSLERWGGGGSISHVKPVEASATHWRVNGTHAKVCAISGERLSNTPPKKLNAEARDLSPSAQIFQLMRADLTSPYIAAESDRQRALVSTARCDYYSRPFRSVHRNSHTTGAFR
jgi:hypothetical protein